MASFMMTLGLAAVLCSGPLEGQGRQRLQVHRTRPHRKRRNPPRSQDSHRRVNPAPPDRGNRAHIARHNTALWWTVLDMKMKLENGALARRASQANRRDTANPLGFAARGALGDQGLLVLA